MSRLYYPEARIVIKAIVENFGDSKSPLDFPAIPRSSTKPRRCSRNLKLRLLEKSGKISELGVHPQFCLEVLGEKVCEYIADFGYRQGGIYVVEDVKSQPTRTPVYRLKKKLVEAEHGITITEVA